MKKYGLILYIFCILIIMSIAYIPKNTNAANPSDDVSDEKLKENFKYIEMLQKINPYQPMSRGRQIKELSNINNADDLIKLLKSNDGAKYTYLIIDKLVNYPTKETVEILKNILLNPREEEGLRCKAAEALLLIGDKSVEPAVIQALHGAENLHSLRYYCVMTLSVVGSSDSLYLLTDILRNDRKERIREAASLSLGAIGDERALSVLEYTMNSGYETESMKSTTARALGLMGTKKALAIVVPHLNSELLLVQLSAILAIADSGDRDMEKELVKVIEKPKNKTAELYAIVVLYYLTGKPEYEKLIMTKYEKGDQQYQIDLFGLMQSFNFEGPQELLIKAVSNNSDEIALYCTRLLIKHGATDKQLEKWGLKKSILEQYEIIKKDLVSKGIIKENTETTPKEGTGKTEEELLKEQ